MALSTYSDLKTAIADWLEDSTTDLSNRAGDFITLAEAHFNRTIRHREMEARATITLTAGDAYISLPTDFLQLRNLTINSNPRWPLTQRSEFGLADFYDENESGEPASFALIGNEIKFGPTPQSAYTVQINYYKRIESLSDSNTTNWLLTNHPDIYLYGSLIQAEAFIFEDQRLAGWLAAYSEAINELNLANKMAQYGSAPLVPTTRTITP